MLEKVYYYARYIITQGILLCKIGHICFGSRAHSFANSCSPPSHIQSPLVTYSDRPGSIWDFKDLVGQMLAFSVGSSHQFHCKTPHFRGSSRLFCGCEDQPKIKALPDISPNRKLDPAKGSGRKFGNHEESSSIQGDTRSPSRRQQTIAIRVSRTEGINLFPSPETPPNGSVTVHHLVDLEPLIERDIIRLSSLKERLRRSLKLPTARSPESKVAELRGHRSPR